LLTDPTIKKEIREALLRGAKTLELKDDGPRGVGRLTLFVRISPPKAGQAEARVTAEWYAVWYDSGDRQKVKMGPYPTKTLADARAEFATDFAPKIAKGEKPESKLAKKPRLGVTVQDLFQTYVDHLRAQGKPCADQVEWMLLKAGKKGAKAAVKSLGPSRRAADVTAQHVIAFLKGIHGRGRIPLANMARAYIGAAFAHAMASENSYTQAAGTVKWGIKVNPVSCIPGDPNARRAGQRYLDETELGDFWAWLVEQDAVGLAAPAARLIICTGQRISEILRVSDKVWKTNDRMLDWGKTKNGKPHNVPVPEQGVGILSGLVVNRQGLYFPRRDDPTKPMVDGVTRLIGRYLEERPAVPKFTARDLRRTWKTLAGAAGLSKEMRDRLQNHARSDISSRHYDRYDMLKERREAMEVWSKYLARIIAGEFKDMDVKTPEPTLEAA
jgi:integrase